MDRAYDANRRIKPGSMVAAPTKVVDKVSGPEDPFAPPGETRIRLLAKLTLVWKITLGAHTWSQQFLSTFDFGCCLASRFISLLISLGLQFARLGSTRVYAY